MTTVTATDADDALNAASNTNDIVTYAIACECFRFSYNIIVNSKKTICIKYGSTIIDGESAF